MPWARACELPEARWETQKTVAAETPQLSLLPISHLEGTPIPEMTSLEVDSGSPGFRLVTGDTRGHTQEVHGVLVCVMRPYQWSWLSADVKTDWGEWGSSLEHLGLSVLGWSSEGLGCFAH